MHAQFDPVAYRLEPLIDKELTARRPALVHYHEGVKGLRFHNSVNAAVETLAARSNVCLVSASHFFSCWCVGR
jgi:hypothetical protein